VDVDSDCALKNFKDAMSHTDRQEWVEALNKEYRGFKERNAPAIVKPQAGKWNAGKAYIVCMVVRGNQRDVYEILDEYKYYIKKLLQPKCVLILLGVILCPKDCPNFPDQLKQEYNRSFVIRASPAVS
jgi:hypothetical protein